MSLKAHYDGERIRLDEPFELPANVPLLVTVLAPDADSERDAWVAAGQRTLARAFGDDEPEYTFDDVTKNDMRSC